MIYRKGRILIHKDTARGRREAASFVEEFPASAALVRGQPYLVELLVDFIFHPLPTAAARRGALLSPE